MAQQNWQGKDDDWLHNEMRLAKIDYFIIKYGNILTLLAYLAGLCLILFSPERKRYFFGIAPLILYILSLGITVTLVWVYVSPEDVIVTDLHSIKYLTGFLSVLDQRGGIFHISVLVDHILYILARWIVVYQIFRVGVLIPLYLDYGRTSLRQP